MENQKNNKQQISNEQIYDREPEMKEKQNKNV